MALFVCGFALLSKAERRDLLIFIAISSETMDIWVFAKLREPMSLMNNWKTCFRQRHWRWLIPRSFICLFLCFSTQDLFHSQTDSCAAHKADNLPSVLTGVHKFGLPLTVNKARDCLCELTAHFGVSSSKHNCPKSNKNPPSGWTLPFKKHYCHCNRGLSGLNSPSFPAAKW